MWEGQGICGKKVMGENAFSFKGQSQTMTRPSSQGNDDSCFELITLRLYIKALRLQQAALEEHLLGISVKQLDTRAESKS